MLCCGVEERVHMLSEHALFGVETDFAEVVTLLFVVHRIVLLQACQVVECPSVGRECGRVFAPFLCGEQRVGENLVRGGLVDEDIAGEVEHFDALAGHDMECLARLVG